MHVDPYCIVDTREIVFAASVDGEEAYDGQYFIVFIIATGEGCVDVMAKYPNKEERNVAMRAIGVLVKADEECYEIDENLEE